MSSFWEYFYSLEQTATHWLFGDIHPMVIGTWLISLIPPIIAFVFNDGLVAIIVAIVGPIVTLWIARWRAKREIKNDDSNDEFRFRGELSTDNQALRGEIKDLKKELKDKNRYIRQLEIEIRTLTEERHVRELADEVASKRSHLGAPK